MPKDLRRASSSRDKKLYYRQKRGYKHKPHNKGIISSAQNKAAITKITATRRAGSETSGGRDIILV
jgi:hypothetical protein